ncbi:fungal-specific transcription factor domain-containing protein [Lentinula aciculospora]|uniref:Fungal-specific transcription factor domain-containing protein n=1 Tax=Lentinula aciculospora TaxID=153920 RepID=A0A9W8ZYN1_9AGAR|nr:fungal-specific transcription factor domain-containing protein [Lentinula aciculospora]
MSDEDSEPREANKKPRLLNACTNCRLKKIKCDSAIRPGNVCSNCSITYKIECIHAPPKKRGGRIGNSRRKQSIRATVDAILSTRRPFEIPNDPVTVKGLLIDLAKHIRVLEEVIDRYQQEAYSVPHSHSDIPPRNALQPSQEEGITNSSLFPNEIPPFSDGCSTDDLSRKLRIFEFDDNSVRHFGSSSSRTLVKAALDIKKEYTGNANFVNMKSSFKRSEFWSVQPWQEIKHESQLPSFEFPPEDLMIDLFELYFSNFNYLLPILHRPSFLRSVSEGLHNKDRHFGGIVLATCALGALFSNDSRVYENQTASERSIGWKWIRQIQPIKQSFSEPPSISEIQLYIVYMTFVGTTTAPEVCWVLISIGVRLLQDVGAHRKRPDSSKPSIETELWNRSFWNIYTLDILASTLLGRPRAMSQNDFDADLPIDCDDEYWDHPDPSLTFQQPAGQPSMMSYWICFLKLMKILGLTLHTIHSVKSSNMWSATSGLSKREWNEKIVSELDSLLNRWTDEIPDHLRWDPNQDNIQHFNQSVVLYTTYYWTQILVHRPFIPRPGEDSHSGILSLAICTNAARSCLHVLEVQQQRKTNVLAIPNVMALFNSAIVILVNMWRGKHFMGSSSSDISKELIEVHRAINALHFHEHRWEQAGRLADILTEVLSVSHFHQSIPSRLSLKRPRMEDNNKHTVFTLPISPEYNDREDLIQQHATGSRRVSAALNFMEMPILPALQEPDRMFSLPLNSIELGSLPIYRPFDWSMPEIQTAADSWAATGAGYTNLPEPHSTLLESFKNTSFDASLMPPVTINEGLVNNSTPNDPEDWASYMATIDELLQAMDSRNT